jgi:hypothetical protein
MQVLEEARRQGRRPAPELDIPRTLSTIVQAWGAQVFSPGACGAQGS